MQTSLWPMFAVPTNTLGRRLASDAGACSLAWPGRMLGKQELEGRARGTCFVLGGCGRPWELCGSRQVSQSLWTSGSTHTEPQIEFAFWLSTCPGAFGIVRGTQSPPGCACGGFKDHLFLAHQRNSLLSLCYVDMLSSTSSKRRKVRAGVWLVGRVSCLHRQSPGLAFPALHKPEVVAHGCHPSTQEWYRQEDSIHLQLCSEFEAVMAL